jgi:hypothetical protein
MTQSPMPTIYDVIIPVREVSTKTEQGEERTPRFLALVIPTFLPIVAGPRLHLTFRGRHDPR